MQANVYFRINFMVSINPWPSIKGFMLTIKLIDK